MSSRPLEDAEEEENSRSQKNDETLTGEAREKFPRDSPASSGSSPGRSNDDIDTSERDESTKDDGGGSGHSSPEQYAMFISRVLHFFFLNHSLFLYIKT